MSARAPTLAALLASGALFACDETRPTTSAPAASGTASAAAGAIDGAFGGRSAEAHTQPSGPGCTRAGSLDSIENDPACVLTQVADDVMRDLERRLSLSVELEPNAVIAGAAAVLRLTITNVAKTETLVVFDAFSRAPGPRTDWSRLAGVPDVKGDKPDTPRLSLTVMTTDLHERNVDAVPVVAGSAAPPAPARLIGVRLRPGGKLTQTLSWWAVRIPAPAPIVQDDAGHRFIPKTTAVNLSAGDYLVLVDVPLHGVHPTERIASTRVHVEPVPKDKPP